VSPAALRSRVDRWQRAHPPAAFAVAVLRKFGDDRASRLAALIAYYAFFSIFPLLLAFVSILGFVLEGNPSLKQDIVDSLFAQMPVIGSRIREDVGAVTGNGLALAIGIVLAVWAGLGVTIALSQAMNRVWDVPRCEQPGFLQARLRGLVVLVLLGVTILVVTGVAGLASAGGVGSTVDRVVAFALSLAVDAVVVLALFRLPASGAPSLRTLLPGALVAAVGLVVLQGIGGVYVDHEVRRASETYGVFALVIGMLSWLWLAAQLLLLSAEVNVVRSQRLWPRSLAGDLTPADITALRRAAESERRDPREHVTATFDDPDPQSPPP
jgi:YihY family inner membrane protein